MGLKRKAPRSKGCEQCVSRHIKCDERPLCCRQCTRLGLLCSGPIVGSVFVEVPNTAFSGSKKKRQKVKKNIHNRTYSLRSVPPKNDVTQSTQSSLAGSSVDQCSSGAPSPATSSAGKKILYTPDGFMDRNFGNNQAVSIVTRIDLNDICINEQYFVAKFVGFIASPRQHRRSWIYTLPGIVSTTTVPAVRYSIRAAALMYYAASSRDYHAGMAAVRWYLAALESYRNKIRMSSQESLLPHSSSFPDSSQIYTALCPPLMFQYFDVMQGFSANHGHEHHGFTCRMIERLGPGKVLNGIEHDMFRSIRTHEALDAVLHNRRSNLASIDWSIAPFINRIKTPWDCMIDILFSFLRLARLPGADMPRSSLGTGISDVYDLSKEDKTDLEKIIQNLMVELDTWWSQLCSSGSFNSTPGTATISYSSLSETLFFAPISEGSVYHKNETAIAVMLYDATRIIMLSIQLVLALSNPARNESPEQSTAIRHIQQSIGFHASSILYNAAQLIERNPYSGDAIRSVFPLKIVAILGLESEMRRKAQVTLDNKWKQPKIL